MSPERKQKSKCSFCTTNTFIFSEGLPRQKGSNFTVEYVEQREDQVSSGSCREKCEVNRGTGDVLPHLQQRLVESVCWVKKMNTGVLITRLLLHSFQSKSKSPYLYTLSFFCSKNISILAFKLEKAACQHTSQSVQRKSGISEKIQSCISEVAGLEDPDQY